MDKIIELSPRLQTIADLVPGGARFADIGTDHAFLPVYLLQSGKISSAIAADIRSGPLSRAQSTGAQYGRGDELQFRLCDGLVGIASHEVDTIAIAGMGGETIVHILSQSPWAWKKNLVLQPMSTQPELRQFLWQKGMTISREKTVAEGDTLYTILQVVEGLQSQPTQGELWVGRQWEGMDDPLRGALLQSVQTKLRHALEGLQHGESQRVEQRRQQLSMLCEALMKMEEEWKRWQR